MLMVSKWWMRAVQPQKRPSIENLRESPMDRFFGKFCGIKPKAITFDLSRTVGQVSRSEPCEFLPAALDILARARARAAAARQDARLAEDAAAQRVRRGTGRNRRGVRYEPVLQASAGRLRGRRPSRHGDRRAGAGRR